MTRGNESGVRSKGRKGMPRQIFDKNKVSLWLSSFPNTFY